MSYIDIDKLLELAWWFLDATWPYGSIVIGLAYAVIFYFIGREELEKARRHESD